MAVETTVLDARARAIVSSAIGGQSAPDQIVGAIQDVFERLDAATSEIIGALGFRAVMGRAVQLSHCPFRWLEDSQADDAAPDALDPAQIIARDGAAVVVDAAVGLLANIMALLCNFVGDNLTLRLLRKAWPNSPELPDRSSRFPGVVALRRSEKNEG